MKHKVPEMKLFYGLSFMILLLAEANSNKISLPQRTREISETNVVSLTFCESRLDAEDKMGKKTLEEVHTYAELKQDPRASFPESFTVCSTIMTTGCQSQKWPTFFTILDNNGGQFLGPFIRHGNIESGLGIGFHDGNSEILTDKLPPLFPKQWAKSCMAVNTTSGFIHWVVGGSLVLAEEFVEMKTPRSQPKNLSKKIVLGARSNGGSWFASTQVVANLEMYSSPLPIEKMKSMTRGGSFEEGDYLSWADMEWILHGQAKIETTEKEETCEEKPLVDLYYTPFPGGMDSCMHHCQNLGTRVPSVATFEEWTKLQTFLKKKLYDKGLNTLEIWLPIEDRETEDVWRDFYTGEVVQNYSHPWTLNGGRAENCARLMSENVWNDRSCDYPDYACICSHKSNTNLKLRGLCVGSAIDVYYKPMNKQADIREVKLRGLTHTSIEFAEEKKKWKLDVAGSNVTATSKASVASFSLGKHNWTIKGDQGCSSRKSYTQELKMSGCQGKEFTCNDGQCVSMEVRCDQMPDCRDESDERNCNHLLLKDSYNKKVPPIHSSDDPVDVSVTIDLLRLVHIVEGDYSIEIQFEIMLEWRDNRATYHNLKKTAALNALTQEDIEKLWLPEVIYENTDQKQSTRLGEFGAGEWKTDVVVRREEENGVMSGPEFVDETEVFRGSENGLVMNQTYTHTFQCNYQLSHYPFDIQVHIFLLFTFPLSFSEMRNRHGDEKFGIGDSDFSAWPDDYDPRSRYAYLPYY